MATKYIFAGVALLFLILAATRGPAHPQGRIWLFMAAIFAGVSGWLFYTGA